MLPLATVCPVLPRTGLDLAHSSAPSLKTIARQIAKEFAQPQLRASGPQ
jgi:hypothetical protein